MTEKKASGESTRERILKAAERIYAASGFHGMSLREVTLLAGVNLAAVNYHYGSKDKLIHAIADRRLTPVNAERIQRLQKLRQEHGDKPIPPADVVASMVDPLFKALRHSKSNRAIMVRLVAQLLIDEPHRFSHIHQAFFQGIVDAYHGELQRTFPNLSPHQLYARFFCASAMLLGLRLTHESMDWFLRVRTESKQLDLLEAEMTAFLLGGLSFQAS